MLAILRNHFYPPCLVCRNSGELNIRSVMLLLLCLLFLVTILRAVVWFDIFMQFSNNIEDKGKKTLFKLKLKAQFFNITAGVVLLTSQQASKNPLAHIYE